MKAQTQIASQLKQLRPHLSRQGGRAPQQAKDRKQPYAPIQNPNNWKGDGVDHINLWEEGDVELGRILSHRYKLDFNHDKFGKFTTMEAFDFWVLSEERDDRLRRLTGMALKNFIKGMKTRKVRNFQAVIMDTNYQRIMQYDVIVNAIRDTDLPFDVYYVIRDSGVRVRPSRFSWMLQGFEEIRRAIKEDRKPNFDFLKDDPKAGIYDNMLKDFPVAQVKKEAAPEKAPAQPPKAQLLEAAAVEVEQAPVEAQAPAEPAVEDKIVSPIEAAAVESDAARVEQNQSTQLLAQSLSEDSVH